MDYAKTRPVFDGYKAARYSKKYLAQHKAELASYRAAKAALNKLLNGGETSQNSGYEKDPPGAGGKEKGPLCKVPQGPGGYAAGRGGQGEH